MSLRWCAGGRKAPARQNQRQVHLHMLPSDGSLNAGFIIQNARHVGAMCVIVFRVTER